MIAKKNKKGRKVRLETEGKSSESEKQGAVQCKKKVVQLGKRTYSELMTQITEDLKWQPKKFELQSKSEL